ncbi:DUF427 domain-containing protein [Granulicella sibirica]|uniref:DUF427 domain-containing protein n=1 Tax=Granulicella sibirica TaxID=2479048 RepID=A0A4Q0T2N1_9BACT|nr:DUF427 domain-containing protein [Granulicella sibirica]RXH57102.1 hypothetical protein GRAN_0412 [Granulicella sibirica]
MTESQNPESVWDYPRPPRLEATARQLRITHGGILLAETTRALRILETSHPPVYYIPQADIAMQFLIPSSSRSSFCEFKGSAVYWNIDLSAEVDEPGSSTVSEDAAWSYPHPTASYTALRDHLAFYANRVDECTVDGAVVMPQPGDFYGGWITSHVKGPFKGAPGTRGW